MPELRTLPELISLQPRSAMAVRALAQHPDGDDNGSDAVGLAAKRGAARRDRLRKRIPTQSRGSSLPVYEGSAG